MGKTGDEWLTVKLAADKKQAELSMLLTSRADPNVMVPVEWRDFATSPLFEAAVSGHTRIARMLLSAGADVNASVGPGYTPVYNAAYNGHADTVRLLAESNADVNAATAEEFTPLYIACQQGHTECVRVLLESNASCNLARAAEGATALYIASQNGHAGCVEALISHGGATIDMPMFDGSTPLMIACYFKHVRVVEMLLRAGASLKLRDKRGRDALDWAKKRDDALVVALVEEELAARVAQGLGGRSEWNPDAESGGQGVGWFGGGGSSGGGGGGWFGMFGGSGGGGGGAGGGGGDGGGGGWDIGVQAGRRLEQPKPVVEEPLGFCRCCLPKAA
jgi:hypothetical protein